MLSIDNGTIKLNPDNNGKTTLQTTATSDITLTLPNITDTIVSRNNNDTLNNKDLTNNTNNIISRGLWTGSGLNSVSTYLASAPLSGQVLTAINSNTAIWQTPNNIASLNSQTASSQTFATGTSGNDFNISSNQNIHTFNIPNASSSNRGLVSTGNQTFSGTKTFANSPNISSIINNGTLTLPIQTDTLIGRNTEDTLSNKLLNNNTTFHIDNTTPSKRIGYNTSSALPNTTLTLSSLQTENRTITFPDITDTLATLTAPQTLSNKTLSNPTISSITNTGLLTLPTITDTLIGRNTSDLLTNKSITSGSITYSIGSASQLLTTVTGTGTLWTQAMIGGLIVFANGTQAFITGFNNSTSLTVDQSQTVPSQNYTLYYNGLQIDNIGNITSNKALYTQTSNTVFFDGLNPSKRLLFQTSGSSGSTALTLASSQTTSQTLTIPNITGPDTLTTLLLPQTLTNKTLTSQSNNITAKGLFSSTTSIDVSSATAPIAGQVLTATSNSSANWQNISSLIALGSSPGGSNTQIQYNNNGNFAGTNKLTISDDFFPIIGDKDGNPPTAPESGAKLFSRLRAGRRTLGQIGPSGVDYSFQPCLWANKVAWWTAQGNGNSVSVINFGNSATGSTRTRTVATTRFFTSIRRIGYESSSQAGNSAGTRHGVQQFWRGNSDGLGGFYYVARFGLSSASTVSTQRSFVGLIASTSLLPNNDPSLNTGILGFGVDSADSTWTFMHNNNVSTVVTGTIALFILTVTAISSGELAIGQIITGSGIAANTVITEFVTGTGGVGTYTINISQSVSSRTITGIATKDELIGTFPPRDLSVSMFEARIFCPPNGSIIYYSLEVLNGGSLYEGSCTTNIPSNTTLLSPQIWTNNGITAAAVGIDIVSQYIETDS